MNVDDFVNWPLAAVLIVFFAGAYLRSTIVRTSREHTKRQVTDTERARLNYLNNQQIKQGKDTQA